MSDEVGKLLSWYAQTARNLPWRTVPPDPYRVWLSEIMLQQTRIEVVRGYFERFLSVYPTVELLAAGDDETLLKLWEGLGYYSRARNLKRAAQMIAAMGRFPETAAELRQLPGIGPYTAGAIASIAFGQKEAAVDGNVLRVLSRLLGRNVERKEAAEFLAARIPDGEASHFTQAWMELGETVCLPHGAPLCGSCPFADCCQALKRGIVDQLPKTPAKKARRTEELTVLLLENGGRFALRRRPDKGLLAGLWEFPHLPGRAGQGEIGQFLAANGLTLRSLIECPDSSHLFTHVEWQMHNFHLRVGGQSDAFVWADRETLTVRCALPSAFAAMKKRIFDEKNAGTR